MKNSRAAGANWAVAEGKARNGSKNGFLSWEWTFIMKLGDAVDIDI